MLVLPNTPDHDSYGPLNQALTAAITKLFLTEENTFYHDAQGVKRAKVRYVYFDEFGDAGHLPQLNDLFTQGRTFGVSFVAGLHQLSSLEAKYGEKEAATILGQFTYKALLKNEDERTKEWNSKQFGERLEKLTKETQNEQSSHDKTTGRSDGTTSSVAHGMNVNLGENESHSGGRTDGKNAGSSRSVSSDPKIKTSKTTQEGTQTSTSEQHTHGTQLSIGLNTQSAVGSTHTTNSSERHGKSSGTTTTWELRKDFNIYPGQFGQFQDPSTTGLIASVHKVPSFTGWRADLPFAALKPEYEREEALHTTPGIKPWADRWEVSRPRAWTSEDYERLGIEPLQVPPTIRHQAHSGFTSPPPALPEQKLLPNIQRFETGEERPPSRLDEFPFEE